jgi:HK97 family phage portal protein
MANFWTKERAWPWQKKQSIDSSSELWSVLLGQAASKSGISITWKSALQYTTAQACMRIIAEDIAQLPCAVYKKVAGGGSEPVPEHPVYKLLKTKPNEHQTAFELREQLGMHLVMTNNAYCWLNKVRGNIVELIPFEPHCVDLKRAKDEHRYVLTLADGHREEVPSGEIWHLRGPSWNGYQGLDGIRLMREAVGLALALEEHGSRMFRNGATVGGILSTESMLQKEQREALRESWEDRHQGVENAYKTAVMWGGMKWAPMGMPNTDAQHLENRRFQVEEVCRAFKVLPIMVGHADKTTTYASAEQMVLIHLRQTLGPWLTRIEQSADCNLLTDDELQAGYFTKYTRNALLAMTAEARSNFYTKLYNVGAINPNEVRAFEDLNPYEGGEQYRVPLNMIDPTDDTSANADDTRKPNETTV